MENWEFGFAMSGLQEQSELNEAKQKRHYDLKSMKCHYLLKMTHCATRLERSGQQQHWYHMSLLRLWPQMDVYGDCLLQLPQRVWGRALNSPLPQGTLLQKCNYYGPRYVSSRVLCCQNKSLSAGNSSIGILKQICKTLTGQGATRKQMLLVSFAGEC